MSRIRKAYEEQFRVMLRRAGARRLEAGVNTLVARAERERQARKVTLTEALARVSEQLALATRPGEWSRKPAPPAGDPVFFCDAGLGGLARWLRAAGYVALWRPAIDDAVLLQEAAREKAIVLTTDGGLMERRPIRDGALRGLWLPPALGSLRQLAMVLRHFDLALRPSRCMSCGGMLARGNKEALRDRIPPRTYLWRNEYFVCQNCGKLFWHGTHWERIRRDLESARPSAA